MLLFWLSRVRGNLMAFALGLVIGGAVGNVIDRLRFDGVVDFLYFHAGRGARRRLRSRGKMFRDDQER
jgi:signal peptidase II